MQEVIFEEALEQILADDLLHLAQCAQAEWEKRVNAARELADETGAQQQFVGKYLRIRRGFAEGRN
jgi:hypothetical protein